MRSSLRCSPIAAHSLSADNRLGLEVAALRQQLVVFERKQPRPQRCDLDRAFWSPRRLWPSWADALIIVKPDTVVSLHRAWVSPVLAMAIPSSTVLVQTDPIADDGRIQAFGPVEALFKDGISTGR